MMTYANQCISGLSQHNGLSSILVSINYINQWMLTDWLCLTLPFVAMLFLVIICAFHSTHLHNNEFALCEMYIKVINSLAPGRFDYSLKLVNFKLISMINILSIFCEIAIRSVPQYLTDHSPHLFRKWLGAVRQQAITWTNVDLDPCRHMTSLGHKELNGHIIFGFHYSHFHNSDLIHMIYIAVIFILNRCPHLPAHMSLCWMESLNYFNLDNDWLFWSSLLFINIQYD